MIWKKNWYAWLTLGGAWAVFCLPWLGEGAPYYRDILRTDLPVRQFIGDALRAGRWPQWYPYDGLGLQFIGNAEGMFRPFTLLYVAIADVVTAMKVELALSYLVGLVGFYCLGRTLKLSVAASLFGAIAFAFNGYSGSLQGNLPYLTPYQTLPWVLLAGYRVLHAEQPYRWVVLTALLWSQILLAGDPLLAIFAGAALSTAVAAERRWRRGLTLLGSAPLTAGLCAVWVMPARALFEESLRKGWAPDGKTMALHLARVPELLLGSVFLHSDQEFTLKRVLDGGAELWVPSIFLGATVLMAVLLAARHGGRPGRAWAVLGLLFAWAALGSAGGLLPVLRTVFPLLGAFRYPEKYLAMTTFAWCVAASYGLEKVSSAPWPELRRTLRGALLALVGLAALVCLSLRFAPGFWALPSEMTEDLALVWALGAASTLLFLGASLAAWFSARTRPALALASPLLLAAELLLANSHLSWLVPREVLTTEPRFCRAAIDAGVGLGRSRVLTDVEHFPPYRSDLDGVVWASTTLNLMEPDASGLCGLESITQPNLSGASARLWHALETVDRQRMGHLFNAGVHVAESANPIKSAGRVLASSGRYVLVSPPLPPLPRAYSADPVWRSLPGDALLALPSLREGTVILEGPPHDPLGPTSERTGPVQVTDYAAEEVTLEVDLPSPRAVVLNDLWAPGWQATVDGSPVDVVRANYLVRAVLVGAGHHQLRFWFEAPDLGLGASISAACLALALGVIGLELRRAQRQQLTR